MLCRVKIVTLVGCTLSIKALLIALRFYETVGRILEKYDQKLVYWKKKMEFKTAGTEGHVIFLSTWKNLIMYSIVLKRNLSQKITAMCMPFCQFLIKFYMNWNADFLNIAQSLKAWCVCNPYLKMSYVKQLHPLVHHCGCDEQVWKSKWN